MSLSTPVFTPAPRRFDDERLQLLRCMLADRDWMDDPTLRARLQRAVAALHASHAAPVDEATWTLLADETAGYLDFRRLRSLEARTRDCPREALHFTRADWQRARAAEAELEYQLRHVRDSSYVPEPMALFRIH